MLGQPMSMLIPQVVGVQPARRAARGRDRHRPRPDRHRAAARDAASSGSSSSSTAPASPALPLADRATIGNMSPEFGSTCAIFPIDAETLRYLRFTGPRRRAGRAGRGLRPASRASGTTSSSEDADLLATRSSSTSATVEPSLAGPKRPQDRVALQQRPGEPSARRSPTTCRATAPRPTRTTRPSRSPTRRRTRRPTARPGHAPGAGARSRPRPTGRRAGAATLARPHAPASVTLDGETLRARPRRRRDRGDHELHEHLEPVGDGRRRAARAQRRRSAGCTRKPWVKTSLAPGLEGRHRVPRPRRAHRAARGARLQPRRLRLHDLHRQLRAAAGGGLAGRRRARPRGRRRCSRATATSRAASTPT